MVEGKKQKIKKSIVIILLVGYFFRVKNLVYQPVWADEIDVITFSAKPLFKLIFEMGRPGHNGPLYYLLVHIWSIFVGITIFTLRYLSVLFGVLSVAVAYQFGSKLLGQWYGTILALFIATSPYLVWYSQDGKMYSSLLFFTFSAMTLLVINNSKHKHFNNLAFIGLTGVSFYLHLASIILLPVYGIAIITNRKAKHYISVFIIFAILLILTVPITKWVLPLWLSPFQTGHYYLQLHEILGIQLLGFSVGLPYQGQIVAATTFMSLFILGIIELSNHNLQKIILPIYFFIPVIILYLISLSMPFYTDRYLIFTAPAFYTICVLGLKRIKDTNLKVAVSVISLAIILNVFAVTYQATTVLKSPP